MAYFDLFGGDLFQLQVAGGKSMPFGLVGYDPDTGTESVGQSTGVKNQSSGILSGKPPARLIKKQQGWFFGESGGDKAGFSGQQRVRVLTGLRSIFGANCQHEFAKKPGCFIKKRSRGRKNSI